MTINVLRQYEIIIEVFESEPRISIISVSEKCDSDKGPKNTLDAKKRKLYENHQQSDVTIYPFQS
jgi:hypothetical protein